MFATAKITMVHSHIYAMLRFLVSFVTLEGGTFTTVASGHVGRAVELCPQPPIA